MDLKAYVIGIKIRTTMTQEEKAREIAIEIEKKSFFLSGFGKEEIL